MRQRSCLGAFLLVVLLAAPVRAGYGDRSAIVLPRSQQVDRLVQANWELHGVRPSAPANDQIFMRRVYLDITGTIPTGREALGFLESKQPNKRQVLIDYLMDTEGYVSHWFNYWADVLRIQSQMNNIEFHGYIDWVKQSLRENKPYDQFVRELILAKGRVWDDGAAGYYLRDQGMPLDNTANTVAIFLGTQIGCAQCHDHPFEAWTQKEFYQIAAFTHAINPRGAVSGDYRTFQQKRRQVETMLSQRNLTPQQKQAVRQVVHQ